MKKIYLMGLSAMFALAVNAQTTIKIKSRAGASEKAASANKVASPAQITGAVTCNTQYTAGSTMTLNFSVNLTNTDSEYGDLLTLTFPAGITPNATGSSASIGGGSGGAETLNGVVGQAISWGDNDNYFGGIPTGTTYTFDVAVTIGAGVTGNQVATYDISGDQYGSTPGDLTGGSCTIFPAGASIVDMKTKLLGVITNTTTGDVAGTNNCSMSTHFVASQIHNMGTNPESNIPVNYSVNGIASTPFTYTGTVNPGDSALVFFPAPGNFSAQGTYKVKAWTALAGDVSAANDTVVFNLYNAIPVALTSSTYNNGVETSDDVNSIYLDWVGLGTSFGLSQANFHSGAQAFFLTISGANPAGTYESFINLPCMDVVNGETYRISYWRKSSASGTLTINGQTGVFTGLDQNSTAMTTNIKPYSAMTPTTATGTSGWQKDSVDYVATANETRYFAIGGKGVLAGASTQINVRIDDIKIEKVVLATGIKTNSIESVSIFPNPNNGIFHINNVEATSSFEVYNVIGDKVFSSQLNKGNNAIDLSNLANGSYFVKINSTNGSTTKKVVISK